MSLREKNLHKRRVNKEHNSNFRAGYVSINEEQLHKTGIRGRKRYIVYLVICLVIAAVVVNLMLTLIMFGILHLSKDGMKSLEFIPNGKLLRFLEDSDMGDMYLMDNTVGSMKDEGLTLSAEQGELILLRILEENGSSVQIDEHGIFVNTTDHFTIRDSETGEIIFSTDYANHLRFPQDVMNIELNEVETGRITSEVNEDLMLKADQNLFLGGGEGIKAQTAKFGINGRFDVNITSKHGEVSLTGAKGIKLGDVASMPKVDDTQPLTGGGFKVCVCMPSGQLFAIPAQYDCHGVTNSGTICAS